MVGADESMRTYWLDWLKDVVGVEEESFDSNRPNIWLEFAPPFDVDVADVVDELPLLPRCSFEDDDIFVPLVLSLLLLPLLLLFTLVPVTLELAELAVVTNILSFDDIL